MKKALTIFFVTLGVMFFCVILAGIYFYITDPLNLKPLLMGNDETEVPLQVEVTDTGVSTENSLEDVEDTADVTDAHPLLNESQEKALDVLGVNPADVPSSITPEQESCFVGVLGSVRVEEVKAGDTPTVSEFFKARACLDI